MSRLDSKQRWRLGIGGAFLTLLLAAVFTFGSLDVPFEPKNWRDALTLYAVSSFITAALLVFGLILTRNMLRLWAESSKEHLGARFKTKMVVGAMAVSLLPVLFMFFVSYSLLNRTLGRWFPRPLEIVSEQTQELLNDLGRDTLPRLHTLGYQAAQHADDAPEAFVQHALGLGLDAVWLYDAQGKFLKGGIVCEDQPEDRSAELCTVSGIQGSQRDSLPSGLEIWRAKNNSYFAARVPMNLREHPNSVLITGYRRNPNF